MTIQTLPLEQVMPGMVLGVDVQDAHGAVLLAAGGEISEALLSALGRRGVQQVSVLVQEVLSEAGREARREVLRARVDHLFRHAGEGAADRFLRQAILEYRLEQ
jgi:hypothetical protein